MALLDLDTKQSLTVILIPVGWCRETVHGKIFALHFKSKAQPISLSPFHSIFHADFILMTPLISAAPMRQNSRSLGITRPLKVF
jgi:hypothetical protein